MDTWGIVIFIAALILYFVVKKNNDGLARFLLFVSGAGFGLIIGGIWVYFVIEKYFG